MQPRDDPSLAPLLPKLCTHRRPSDACVDKVHGPTVFSAKAQRESSDEEVDTQAAGLNSGVLDKWHLVLPHVPHMCPKHLGCLVYGR